MCTAGEMKHGPIALIDSNMPVVAIAPRDPLYKKMLSNIEEGTNIKILFTKNYRLPVMRSTEA
jgi:glucosamine 6-phosphate synthetase-like amidotransferase/phosphosugar isomerase protein